MMPWFAMMVVLMSVENKARKKKCVARQVDRVSKRISKIEVGG